jgi:predicted RNase H-like HicB family nuclease
MGKKSFPVAYFYKKSHKMKADLSNGLNLRVEGEIGKHNTLPVEYLVKLAENLQKFLQDIAKYQLETDGAIDLNNFKIELSGFRIGSAIPEFVYTSRIKTVTSGDVLEQRKFVNQKFEEYLKIADSGNYELIKAAVPQAVIRNIMVEDIYNFSTTFGNSPLSVVEIQDKKIVTVYKIHKFKPEIKAKLKTTISESENIKEEFDAIAKVKVIRKDGVTKRIPKEIFVGKHADAGFSMDTIIYNETVYSLAFPLRCKLEKEEDYFVIESEMIGVVGTGETMDEAEKNFSEEFHYIFERYNQLPDKKLGERVKRIKTILNSIVVKTEN